MAKEIIEINQILVDTLKLAKANLKKAQAEVTEAEYAVFLAGGNRIPEKGTIYMNGEIKVATGFTEIWDEELLQGIEQTWPTVSNLPFPFKKIFKADGKQITYLRDNVKPNYDIIAVALTLKPKKPSFTLADEKE